MTTTTTQTAANIRSSRTPSRRDFEIFHQAEILGLTHAEIALDHRLTRRRVSQIVARTRRWLSLHPCRDPHLASELQRKQLARHTERMHLEYVLSQARNELIHGKKELTTTMTKDDGTTTTTVRQQPFNVQVLKTYLRTAQALAKLQQQPDVNIPLPEESEFPWLEGAINEVYDKWSDKIWSGKLKPQGIYDLIEEIVAATLKAAATQARFREGEAPAEPVGRAMPAAEPTPARSASEGNVVSSTNDPATPADPLSTEYSVPSTPASPQSADTVGRGSLDPAQPTTEGLPPASNSSFIIHHSSFPNASPTSLPEPPSSHDLLLGDAAPTSVATDTSASSPSAESVPPTAPASPKNQKREAPQFSLAPYPSIPLSASPSVAPPCTATD